MRPFSASPTTRRLYVVPLWTVGVVLLTPLILLGGLVAVVALTAMTMSRPVGRTPGRRPASALPAVLRLDASTEPRMAALGQRAA